MKTRKLKALQVIAEAQFAIERHSSAAVLQREAQLRAALAKLQDQAQAAERALNESNDPDVVGSGPLWQSWVARKRLELQSGLAGNAADRDKAMRRLKRAFGRQQAIDAGVRQLELRQATTKTRRMIASLLD